VVDVNSTAAGSISDVLASDKPLMPASHWPHEPRHPVGGVHFDEVGARVRMDTRQSPDFFPRVMSADRHATLTRSVCCAMNPLRITLLAELVRSPDGQLETNGSGLPAQVLNADRGGARLAGQIQLLIRIDQTRWDAQLAGLDSLDLLTVPADEAIH
jgi:hypothetical protein